MTIYYSDPPEIASALLKTPQQFVNDQAQQSPQGRADLEFEAKIRERMDELSQSARDERDQQWEQSFRQVLRQAVAQGGTGVPKGQLPLANDKYMMEKLDPRHRMGDLLLVCLNEYDRRKPHLPFFEWIASVPEFELMKLFVGVRARGAPDTLMPSVVKAFVQGVAYLDGKTRRSYVISFRNGRMYQNDVLFDTANHSTCFSGVGWAIYVLSPDDRKKFYAASHKFGLFHHSSFLQGNPVTCAGELQVQQGRLVTLTPKTGHYRTPPDNFRRCIEHLRDVRHIAPHSYQVPVYRGMSQDPVMVKADEFLRGFNNFRVWA